MIFFVVLERLMDNKINANVTRSCKSISCKGSETKGYTCENRNSQEFRSCKNSSCQTNTSRAIFKKILRDANLRYR